MAERNYDSPALAILAKEPVESDLGENVEDDDEGGGFSEAFEEYAEAIEIPEAKRGAAKSAMRSMLEIVVLDME